MIEIQYNPIREPQSSGYTKEIIQMRLQRLKMKYDKSYESELGYLNEIVSDPAKLHASQSVSQSMDLHLGSGIKKPDTAE